MRAAAGLAEPPAFVVVSGEAGIGKTRLIAELSTRPELAGRQLLVGRSHRLRESFPLGPLIEALRGIDRSAPPRTLSPVAGSLRPLLPELADLLPAPPPPLDDRAAERHRVFRGLRELLGWLGPVVLVIEDLHWADEQTGEFLSYLLAEPPPELGLVVTFRFEDLSPGLAALAAGRPTAVRRIEVALGPLDVPQTGALAAAIVGAERVSEEFATYLCERTSGIPFAVEELLALLRVRGSLVRRGGGWARRALDELDVPATIRDSVLERLSRLSPEARAIGEAAAILGVPVPMRVLVATCRERPAEPARAVEEGLEAGLLAEDGDAVGFRHLLAAQAVYEGIAGPRRRELHSRAAAALEAPGPDALGQVAHHLRHAGRIDEWVEAAERAADHMLELAHDGEAVRLLEDLLRSDRPDAERRGRLTIKLARAAIEGLRGREVVGLLLEVLDRGLPDATRGEARFHVGRLLHEVGEDPERVRQLLTEAIDELDGRPDLQAWAMVILGIPVDQRVGLDEHRRWLDGALELLPRIDDPGFEVFLLGKVAMILTPIGDPGWRRLAARIEERTGGAPRQRGEVNAFWSVGAQATCAGHHEVAARLLERGLEGAVSGENRRLELSLRSALALLDLCRGSWSGLDEQVETLIDELDQSPRARVDVEVVSACLAPLRGDLEAARRALADAVDRCMDLGAFDILPIPTRALIGVQLAGGLVEDAVITAERLVGAVDAKGVWPPDMRALPAIAEALVTAGQSDAAETLVARWEEGLADLDAPLAAAGLVEARGFISLGARDLASAADLFLEAARLYADRLCPYEAAAAGERGAGCLLAAGRDGAEAPLLSALATYRRLGARREADRAMHLARQHGIRVPARHRGGRRGYGTELSPREREVAELAALGRSNKEIAAGLFLSVNTVARHLTAAMRKLDVPSRAALGHRLAGEPIESGEQN